MDVNRKELSAIKAVLKDSPRGMTVTEISKSIQMNRHSVAKYMEVLVAAGHVDMRTFGPSKVYYLSQRVPLSAMLSFSSDLIIILDKDLLARNVNDKFLEYMGLSREEVLNKNIEKFSFPINMDPPLIPHVKAALAGEEGSADTFYKCGSQESYFIAKYIPTVFEDGENGVTLILSDITERKRIENAIRDSERKFRDMLEQSTDGISLSDEHGIVTEYNLGYEKLTGLAKNEVVGKYVWEIPFFIKGYEQIRDRHHKRIKDYTIEFLKTGKSPLTDRLNMYNLERPDGTMRTVMANIFPIKTDKGHILCSIARDITDMRMAEMAIKDSEEKFRSIIEQSLDGIMLVDKAGKVIEFNKGLELITGRKKADMIGKPAWGAYNLMRGRKGRKSPRSLETFKTLVASDASTYTSADRKFYEVEILRADGVRRILQALHFEIRVEKSDMDCIMLRDITEQKQAEMGLKESEEKFRNLAETTTSGILIMQAGRITYANPAAESITGYSLEDLLNIDMFDFVHPMYKEAVENIRSYYRKNDMKWPRKPYELKIIKKGGSERWIEVTQGSMQLNGHPSIITTFFDITERKTAEEALLKERGALEMRVKERTIELESANITLKAEIEQRIRSENALRESEEKYRNLTENITDVAWETDGEGRFTYISPKLEDILGYEPSEFIGQTIHGFLAPAHADDMAAKIEELFSDPKPYTLQETCILHKAGREVIVEASGTVICDDQGNFKGYRGVTRDVTARKQAEDALWKAEEKFRHLVENVNDWIWETDNTGRFVYSSPKVYDMLGYRPEEVVGLRPFDMMMPENGKKLYYRMMEMTQRGEAFTALEGEHLHKDGHTVFVEVSGKPIYDKQGAVTGYTGIAHDITERKIAEERLLQTTAELKAIFSAFPDVIFRVRKDGTIIGYNTARSDRLFARTESLLGKNISDVLPQGVGQKARDAIKQVNSTGKMSMIEYVLRLGDKEEAFEARIHPTSGDQILIIVRPVTEKKRMEKALRVSEGRFRSLVENISDIAWEMDKAARFTYISPKVRDILGYGPEHYIGKAITEFLLPEDLPKFSPGFGQAFANPGPYTLEHLRMADKDGSVHSMELSGTPFYDEKGQFLGFRGVTRDVTKRKQVEDLLGMMKDSMAVPKARNPK